MKGGAETIAMPIVVASCRIAALAVSAVATDMIYSRVVPRPRVMRTASRDSVVAAVVKEDHCYPLFAE